MLLSYQILWGLRDSPPAGGSDTSSSTGNLATFPLQVITTLGAAQKEYCLDLLLRKLRYFGCLLNDWRLGFLGGGKMGDGRLRVGCLRRWECLRPKN